MKLLTITVMMTSFIVSSSSDDVILTTKSNEVTWLDPSQLNSTRALRQRRNTLNSFEQEQVVGFHNQLRIKEHSSDMELMTWNDDLADMAEDWAQGCAFVHGQPKRDPKTVPYNPIGQNLYAVSGAQLNVTRAVQEWYNEKSYYNYDTLQCTAGEMCGHYTQVVWASTRQVGCAFHYCDVLESSSLRLAYYFVCNYGPAGNYRGEKAFKNGQQCSQCKSGIGWCTDGLCNSDCKRSGPNCKCGAVCHNCATLKTDTCRCQCADGWHGHDCSVLCEDTNKNCNANPGWPPHWCNHPSNGDYVREGCPAMCGLCKRVDGVKPGLCAPRGGLGYSNSSGSVINNQQYIFSCTVYFVVIIAFTRVSHT